MTHLHTCTNQSDLAQLTSSYFVRMMLPDAEAIAAPYVKEEQQAVIQLLETLPDAMERNLIVVGAGPLWYRKLVEGKVKKYIAVEPQAELFITSDQKKQLEDDTFTQIIDKEFGTFPAKLLPQNSSVFLFHFNIISYIPHPIQALNTYCRKGDILYFSTWNTSEKAKQVRREYFNFLNASTDQSDYVIDPEQTTGLCNLQTFPFEKLSHYHSHTYVTGEITETLIINC